MRKPWILDIMRMRTDLYHTGPAGLLVGFSSEDDWFDYRLEHDPRFQARIAAARKSLGRGKGIKLEDLSE